MGEVNRAALKDGSTLTFKCSGRIDAPKARASVCLKELCRRRWVDGRVEGECVSTREGPDIDHFGVITGAQCCASHQLSTLQECAAYERPRRQDIARATNNRYFGGNGFFSPVFRHGVLQTQLAPDVQTLINRSTMISEVPTQPQSTSCFPRQDADSTAIGDPGAGIWVPSSTVFSSLCRTRLKTSKRLGVSFDSADFIGKVYRVQLLWTTRWSQTFRIRECGQAVRCQGTQPIRENPYWPKTG
ncbi:uncharacterized protein ARMOST_11422 [Armillaria ostoyae]|uniref:Uncharacterized protein n=1 Tax=Armillaria ostoyae TaxID=47428 RepID=A0A284RH28_ARMOS|nr:uncharacterized protein ARMOST_11422 [Armillaria ostoyae]